MPTIPASKELIRDAVKITNTIRENASPQFQAAVPAVVEGNLASLRAVGDVFYNYQPLANEYLAALVNRIGRVWLTSKMYTNPWAFMKKGFLEFGETVEEIFVQLAKPKNFNVKQAETDVYKRTTPDVKAAYHYMNYQQVYPTTIENEQLRQAFLSWQGITDLIAKIVDAMYTGANYDEFLTMKYMIAKFALNGKITPITIPEPSEATAKQIVTAIKGVSNKWIFESTKYNMAGVTTYTNKDDQMVIKTADLDALVNVEVLALAFNEDRSRFAGRQVLVDSFSDTDIDRLNLLFENDPTYVPFTPEQLTMLSTIKTVMLDREFFMIFDKLMNFTENYNGLGLYWNYFYHRWAIFSASPFCNAALFTTATNSITSVTVNPNAASVAKGATQQFTATVVTTGFAKTDVLWEISGDGMTSTIDQTGKVRIGTGETASELTVTARSLFDNTKFGTATITVTD